MHYLGIFLGVILSSIGLNFIILYMNLFSFGYSFLEYVYFISKRLECLLFLIGLVLILFSMRGWIKSVLLLRHTTKLSRR